MVLKPSLSVNQRQKLALSTTMRQSLALLRMPTLELCDEIAREAEENPFLVVEYSEESGGSAYDFALATSAAPESLSDALARQIAIQNLDQATEAAALYLVGELREDGYLDVSLPELADGTSLPLGTLEAGLAALQKCAPAGIGARTLTECLCLQLIDAGIEPDLARTVVLYLNDFADGRWARLGRALGLDRAELRRLAAMLYSFASAPVPTDPIWGTARIPELIVERPGNGQLTVELLSAALPRLSVIPVNRADLNDAGLKAYYDRATQMRSGVLARSETLRRIGRHIVQTQSAFFAGRHTTLVPITRSDAATALAMHASTLGRAIAGKSLVADDRLYPMSMFFSRALVGDNGAISPFDIQQKIRSMIAAESQASPHTDESICALLRQEGVDIARRTVAKYRKCMRIPSSFARRRRKVQVEDQPPTGRNARTPERPPPAPSFRSGD